MLTLVLKKKTFYFWRKPLSSNKWNSYGNQNGTLLCQHFYGDLEEWLLLSSLKQPLSWFRFIDDVDMKWTHGDKEFDEFLEHAIFSSLYSRRSFLLISLAFENPLSITLSLHPRLFKWWRKSPSLCLVVSTVEHRCWKVLMFVFGSLERNCKKWNAGQVVPWTTRCSVPAT
jgi:hypothetical protein